MAGSSFSSTTARVVAVLALTVAVAATLPTTTGAYKPPAGGSCKCARTSSAGACIVLLRYKKGSTTEGTCKAGGDVCEAPWECTDAGPTHVCLSQVVTSTLQCKEGTGGKRCPCVRSKVDDVTLVPTQLLPDGRSGGKGPLPPPQKPSCKAKGAIISVEGKPWQCVRSMDIKERTAAQAYDYRNARNNGWKTQDDYVNMNFLRDSASRLYMCVTYGSFKKSDLPEMKRAASSFLTSSTPNRFYFQDDVPSKTKAGEPKGDSYTPANGSPAHQLSASHEWNDVKTDGYCVDVAAEMVVDFSGLTYVKGLALGMGSVKAYPETGKWAFWDMDTKERTKSLAYDSAGRLYPAKMQAKKWTGAGSPPANCVHRVTVTATCNCKNWENKALKAARAAKA
ncbi:hypothetical protein I4F81_000870 [Pyropia yezoensis]|uniref:Uncharacterized protein n=1 Tax=Pyropia yezoensis TaxID=2788 RepID=A0ACC3BKI1_PYRYE|nr:hypothetical protein I4F81_000870 [Neopyropia yezoensis]